MCDLKAAGRSVRRMDRKSVMSWLEGLAQDDWRQFHSDSEVQEIAKAAFALLKEQEPDASKYQYKYDHTDCLWYRDSRSKCPVTCSQYRDGWNDAMDFVFKNGAGYSPYKRR